MSQWSKTGIIEITCYANVRLVNSSVTYYFDFANDCNTFLLVAGGSSPKAITFTAVSY